MTPAHRYEHTQVQVAPEAPAEGPLWATQVAIEIGNYLITGNQIGHIILAPLVVFSGLFVLPFTLLFDTVLFFGRLLSGASTKELFPKGRSVAKVALAFGAIVAVSTMAVVSYVDDRASDRFAERVSHCMSADYWDRPATVDCTGVYGD